MPPSSPWSFPSSQTSSISAWPPRVAAGRRRAAVVARVLLLAPALGAAHGVSPGRLVAALDPAGLSLAWPAGVAAAAGAVPAPAAAPVAPAAAPVAPAASPEALPARWEVRTQDITLSRTLERWAAQAGYRLKWDAARNFLIGASDVYEGGFEDALQAVLGSAGIRGSDYPLEACIYANTPPLVRITRQGEQSRECHAS